MDAGAFRTSVFPCVLLHIAGADQSGKGKGQAMSVKKIITYTYRGQIERGNGKPGYDWHEGYSQDSSEGLPLYPWMTKRECFADAKAQGAQAQFYTPPGPGARRFEPEVL